MWIELADGRMVNSKHIKDIKESKESKDGSAEILMEDGQIVYSTSSFKELKNLLLPVTGRRTLMEGADK